MILADANLLLYAYNVDSPQFEKARHWLEKQLSAPAPFCFSWQTITAFIRIGTNPRAFLKPLSLNEAMQIVSEWLERPQSIILVPGEKHWEILQELITKGQAVGPLATDAHLAALAIEHGATLATNDRDFSRFPGVRTINPLEQQN